MLDRVFLVATMLLACVVPMVARAGRTGFRALPALTLTALSLLQPAGTSSVHAAAACATAPSGLVSWWRGEGTAYDTAGKNHGALQGGITFAPGKVGQAFALDGLNDSADLGPWMNLQVFTIGMWVKPGASQVQFADILDNNHTGSRSWVIQQDGSASPNQYVWGAAGGGVFFSLTADTWQYLTITRDASGVSRVYVNGGLVGSTTTSGNIFYDGSQYVRVGHWGGGGRYWNGLVDEVDIYNAALGEADIQRVYQADSAGKCVPASPAAPPAPANAIYVNDFESGATAGWSSSALDTAPAGRKFLGQFSTGNNTVSLTLPALPAHSDLVVAFDVYAIRSWDGNAGGCCGPDAFELRADGVANPVLLRTTFSNDHPVTSAAGQAYPGPDPSYPPRTGAAEVNTLGYTIADQFIPGPIPMDAVYRLQAHFPHTAGSVTLTFSSSLAQGLLDESWGLDNVAVSITPPPNQPPTANTGGPYTVPEGGSVPLAGSGSDPDMGDTLSYAWDLDGDGTFETAGENAAYSAAGVDGPATRTVVFRVCDSHDACSTANATVSVVNATPIPTIAGAPADGPEGAPISLRGSATDSSPADTAAGFTYRWSVTRNGAIYGSPGTGPSYTFTPDDNGTFVVTLEASDKDGGTGSDSTSISASNVPPAVTSVAASGASAVTGAAVSFSGTATDPSSADAAAGLRWQWSIDGSAYSAPSTSNVLSYAFTACGDHAVNARALDKDGGISAPVPASVVKAYDAHFQAPLNEGLFNTVQAGRVVPVKVSIGCGSTALAGMAPAIQLLKGNVSPANEVNADPVETLSASPADTTGLMRETSGFYLYNLLVPSDSSARPGALYTIRVRPFGDANASAAIYIVLRIK